MEPLDECRPGKTGCVEGHVSIDDQSICGVLQTIQELGDIFAWIYGVADIVLAIEEGLNGTLLCCKGYCCTP